MNDAFMDDPRNSSDIDPGLTQRVSQADQEHTTLLVDHDVHDNHCRIFPTRLSRKNSWFVLT